ncbi:MAG: serine protease [Gammaproteobacteria bacterium]|jgi:hypothetical protein
MIALVLLVFAKAVFPAEQQQQTIAKDEAEQLFSSHKQSIYQIRVIELATGNKASIGSGFLVDKQGYIATNFHVVSGYVHQPSRYRLEYATVDGDTGPLQLVDIDVVHDLAITKSELNTETLHAIALGNSKMPNGTRIFSLGNPHDLGLSVVEGTYNGLLEKSLFDKIFFSGSLNPGMSGGPTLNRRGEVVGINVSTAGNQVSFLVPVDFLKTLLAELKADQASEPDFEKRIEQQLYDHQQTFFEQLISKDWETTTLGPFRLPATIHDIFKCWGDSDDDSEALMDHAYSNCYSEDQIYLTHRFTTGGIAYTYDLYRSKELGSLHFYNLYSREYHHAVRVNTANKDEVENFECHVDFVSFSAKDWKVSLCTRQYVKYPSLYDMTTAIALVSEKDIGLIIQLAAAGVDQDTALSLTRKFIQHISWQP